MDSLSLSLQQALVFLTYSSIIMLIIITIFLVKLVIDTSRLINVLHEIAVITKLEFKPLIEELQTSLKVVNSVCKAADNQVLGVKNIISSFMDTSLDVFGKAKSVPSIFMKGALAGFKIFKGYSRKK